MFNLGVRLASPDIFTIYDFLTSRDVLLMIGWMHTIKELLQHASLVQLEEHMTTDHTTGVRLLYGVL